MSIKKHLWKNQLFENFVSELFSNAPALLSIYGGGGGGGGLPYLTGNMLRDDFNGPINYTSNVQHIAAVGKSPGKPQQSQDVDPMLG